MFFYQYQAPKGAEKNKESKVKENKEKFP